MLKVFSYGGGVQSTAALVLSVLKRLDYHTFLFCNVGEDSEQPATLEYVHTVALPFARAHGVEIIELQKTRFGAPDTLYQQLTRPESRSIGIPVRMSTSGAPGNRACTADFKIRVVDKWLVEHGAREDGASVGLGISLDEFTRMRTNTDKKTMAWKTLDYPLIDMRLDRAQCQEIIRRAGLPVPSKSSCWFCPYHSIQTWQEMRQKQPTLFWKAVELEKTLNETRSRLNLDRVWLTRKLKPLDQATCELDQLSLFEGDEICESGYCFM